MFVTSDQVKAHITTLDPSLIIIRPHHSASYIWEVLCPGAFGRMSYGFSSESSLVEWANNYFARPRAGE